MKMDMGFVMPKIGEKEFVVKCNGTISKEPYSIFKTLNFVKEFNPDRRKKFAVQIALVGEMVKPNSWEQWLAGIKKEYIRDQARIEIARKLFGERMPLIPNIISQESGHDKSKCSKNKEGVERAVESPMPLQLQMSPYVRSSERIPVHSPVENRRMYPISDNYLMTPPEAREEKSSPLAAFRKAEKHQILKKRYPGIVHRDNQMERCVRNESYVKKKDRTKTCVKKPVGNKLKVLKGRKKRRKISFVLNEGAESRAVNFAIGDRMFSQTELVRWSQSRMPKRSKRLKKCKLNLMEDK